MKRNKLQVILFLILVSSIVFNILSFLNGYSQIRPYVCVCEEAVVTLKPMHQKSNSTFQSIQQSDQMKNEYIEKVNHALIKVSQHLTSAHRYARSGITMKEINAAYSKLQATIEGNFDYRTLHLLQSLSHFVQDNTRFTRVDECPEIYDEINNDFKTIPCNKRPIEKVISFVFLLSNCSNARDILSGLPKQYSDISIVVGVEERNHVCESLIQSMQSKQHSRLHVIESNIRNDAEGWKTLIDRVNTKYVFVGRDLYSLNNQASIERLIRILSVTRVDAIGGSERLRDGHWTTGCYQMSIKNYTLRLLNGYDQSYNSCIYCDYLSTAFVSRRDTLLSTLSYTSTMIGSAVFVDYFLNLFGPEKIAAMSCPDVMFSTVNNRITQQTKQMWQSIARKWKFNRIALPENINFSFDCFESEIECTVYTEKETKGELVPPCCLEILRNEIIKMMNTFDEKGVYMELYEGTLAGAVKFSSTLPWEIDADMIYLVENLNLFRTVLNKLFDHAGYSIGKQQGRERYTISFSSWFVDLHGFHLNSSDRYLYPTPTKVLIDGVWLNSPPNPALSLRKHFGDDIFQHVEHRRPIFNNQLSINWTRIKRGFFLECDKGNFHGCLHNYMPSGNIQFRDVWM